MAELTNLDSKLAEVLGLAQAAQKATEKVSGLVDDESINERLQQMQDDAAEIERRCTEYAETLDGKKTAILDSARETKSEATEMMETYLGSDADDLDGFEFLTMAEAGEVGHWQILGELNNQVNDGQLKEIVDWATPLQERHFETVRECSLQLAAEEDALAPA